MSGDGDDYFPTGESSSLSSISFENGIYDWAYLSNRPDEFSNSNTVAWSENTLFFASFDKKSLDGSNFQYGNDVSSIKLKRREIGYENKPWVLVYEYYINDDILNFIYDDYFARGRNTEFEYSLTPVTTDGVELPCIKTKVRSDFSGAVISDGETSYHILLDPEITETERNRRSSVVTTLNSKYPFIFFGGKSNYTTGAFSGTAIRYLSNDTFDTAQSHWYREDMIDWLTNGDPKVLKIEDGRIWMVVVNGNVRASNSEHPDKVTLSFDFTEIGDVNNESDIINQGLASHLDVINEDEMFTISTNFYYVTIDNLTTSVRYKSSYTAKLTAATDYALNGVVVIMDGINITGTAYNKDTHEINIAQVTGNVAITASATRVRIVAQSFSLTESSVSILIHNTHKLEWTTYPASASQNVITWKCDNTSTATVNNDGIVEGIAAGTATITAIMDGLIATCKVTVTT